MIDWGLVGGIYAMFHACHGIADYWLQTDWQAQNKSKNWHALLTATSLDATRASWSHCGKSMRIGKRVFYKSIPHR